MMQVHLKIKCPFELVACPYANKGCAKLVLREKLEEHLAGKCEKAPVCYCGKKFENGRDEHFACVAKLREQIRVVNKKVSGANRLILKNIRKQNKSAKKSESIPISNPTEETKSSPTIQPKKLQIEESKSKLSELEINSAATSDSLSPKKNRELSVSETSEEGGIPLTEAICQCRTCGKKFASSKLAEHVVVCGSSVQGTRSLPVRTAVAQ
eukprot:TRINITY_DN1053_c0_g1_i14.p1 TRINITY_DN1053_c0_g1~~TRINITY_DN1053_c0_g1_i14.p1  ORF type:complete len:211 (-),score=42.31 TRINITY_DN1053_c0_g1_i14:131-763(-)